METEETVNVPLRDYELNSVEDFAKSVGLPFFDCLSLENGDIKYYFDGKYLYSIFKRRIKLDG